MAIQRKRADAWAALNRRAWRLSVLKWALALSRRDSLDAILECCAKSHGAVSSTPRWHNFGPSIRASGFSNPTRCWTADFDLMLQPSRCPR